MEATKGHSVVMNFSTMPQWMWKTEKPVLYPADPDEIAWNYVQGTEPRDPTFKEIADYYARLLAWYTQGGFTDELGKRHESGHHYSIRCWEVLNEVDGEHQMSPETYTKLYDAVVTALRKVQPDLKFVGMSLKSPMYLPRFFEYFLDPKNHEPGIPLDYISYHFYAMAESDVPPESQGPVFFARADGFLNSVRYIEAIRDRLSPKTGMMINEIGAFAEPDTSNDLTKPLPAFHLNRSAAMYAYLFGELSRTGIDAAGASLLAGYAKGTATASMKATDVQRQSISMVDWKTGAPNARFRVLELLNANIVPGDRIVNANVDSAKVYAIGYLGQKGERKILLVNKRDREIHVTIPQRAKFLQRVDETTLAESPLTESANSDSLTLLPYAVMVVTLE